MIIFCFPYAGGSGFAYMPWRGKTEAEIYPLEYRGHATRQKEMPDTSISEIAADMADKIISVIDNESKEFCLFGHSMGGLVSYETALVLLQRGYRPERLYLSACSAPGGELQEQWKHPVDDVPEGLLRHSGITNEMRHSAVFMNNILPLTQHDLNLVRDYYSQNNEVTKLPYPVTCLAGERDQFNSPESMLAWKKVSEEFEYILFNGSHFYFDEPEQKKRLLKILDGSKTNVKVRVKEWL